MEDIVNCKDLCISNQALHDAIHEDLTVLDEEPEEREILPKTHSIDPADCHTSYTPQIIQDIIDLQTYIISNYSHNLANRVLIFVDDAPALGIFKKSHADIFAKFCCTLRHYKCSLLFAQHMFKCTPKICRHQITCGIFFSCNETEQKEIWESFSCNMPFYKWQEYFHILTSQQYHHVTINLKNSPGRKMIKGFEEYIC
jgi:hypothetical protein